MVARGLTFEAPSETPAGWTAFRFDNQSDMVHFAVVERMPEGTGVQRHQDEVAPVFQEGYELLIRGESEAPPPAPDLRVILSSQSGITMEGEPAAGSQTFMVEYEDQTVHENFLGHDVHLARIDEDTDLDAVGVWMDWTRPDGLETPAPVTFMGGLNEMADGATGYFTVTLEPGRYALVAEITDPQGKGLLHTFTVPEPG